MAMNAYARLMRLDRPVGIWLLFWPSVWGLALAAPEIISIDFMRYTILFLIGSVVMRSAGCVINDIWDRKLDARVARTRTRPLASGEVKLRAAIILLAVLLLFAFIIWWQINFLAKFLCIIALVLVVAYPAMKRITWWPQAFLGITFNFGVLVGYAALAGHLSVAAVILYLGAIFWTMGYDTIYAHQDIEDDRMVGIKSTAIKFQGNPKRFVALCYALAVLLWWLALMLFSVAWWAYGLLAMVGLQLVWQLVGWRPDDPQNCLVIFKRNVQTGILMAALVVAIRLL